MYPLIRLCTTRIRSFFAPSIRFDGEVETRFKCMPWDLDTFLEMNNGRVLTLYDLGRFDLAFRTGLMKILRRKKWGLVVAGASVRYRNRVKALDDVTIRTRVAGFDDRWIYIVQSMWVGDIPCSSILLRTAVTRKGRAVTTDELAETLGLDASFISLPDWVASWIQGEKDRPWPPPK